MQPLLAIAPDFGASTQGLDPLAYNGEEAVSIQKTVGSGSAWLGAAAAEPAFKRVADRFRVLHFSTHGVLDDRYPGLSFLAFSEQGDSLENSRLRVSEIYGLRLSAELVVLSACETANGRLFRGEGLMSISRAFQQAGAGAVVASLWNVDDRHTPALLEAFYGFLQKKWAKSDALAAAKRGYLDGAAGQKGHPFFWAGFVLYGDDAAVFVGKKYGWIGWGGGALAVLLAGALLLWWKPRKAEKRRTRTTFALF